MEIDHDFLESGDDWGSLALQYSFPTSLPAYYTLFPAHYLDFSIGTETQLTSSSNASSRDQQDIVRFFLDSPAALSGYSGAKTVNTVLVETANTDIGGGTENYRVSFSDVVDATFSEASSGNGDIVVMNMERGSSSDPSKGYTPSSAAQLLGVAGDVFINSLDTDALTDLSPGQYGFWLLLHELGHAIGGFEDVRDTAAHNEYFDNQKYTIMSDNTYGGVYASGLGLLDIATLRDTYAHSGTDTRDADTTYALGAGLGFDGATSTTAFLYTIWDEGGDADVIDASGFGVRAEIDLREGHFSSIGVDANGDPWADDSFALTGVDPDPGNVAIAYGVEIENAIGTDYDDIFHGVQGKDNEINGGEGSDTIDYSDALSGVTVDLSMETASEDGDGGVDTLISIEYVRGSAFDDTLTGNSDYNLFYASTGNDTIDGGDTSFALKAVSYADLGAGIVSTRTSLTWEVQKGEGGALGTDTLTHIDDIVATPYDDQFYDSDTSSSPTYAGGQGNDLYVFDLSAVNGAAYVVEAANEGDDMITLQNYDSGDMAANFSYDVVNDVFDFRVFAAIDLEHTVYQEFFSVYVETDQPYNYVGETEYLTVSARTYFLADVIALAAYTADALDEAVDISGLNSLISFNNFAVGSPGNDNVEGGADDDFLAGKHGNDMVSGGSGNDVYSFDVGDGSDIFYDTDGYETLCFGAGIAFEDVSFSRYADDAIITFAGSPGDQITISDYYVDFMDTGYNVVELVRFGSDNSYYDLPALLDSAPVALDDDIEGDEDSVINGNVLDDNGNGADYDSDDYDEFNLYVEENSFATAHGSVEIHSDGSFEYTPDADYYGSDSFEYVLGDYFGVTSIGTVNLTIDNANERPVAESDDIYVDFGSPYTGNVLTNDSDIDGGTLTVVQSFITSDHGYAVSMSANGNFTMSLPEDKITGDTFNYTISDGQGGTSDYTTATLHIDLPEDSIIGNSSANSINGTSSTDTLIGLGGNDTLTGLADNDVLYGGSGNDTLYGGLGTDTLVGGSGADTFAFEAASAFSNVDVIKDFSAGQNDKIDLHDILDVVFDPLTDAIADFVNFTNSGGDSIMSVDRDGTGTTYGFDNAATLTGLNGLDETTLYNNGNLLAA